MDTQNQCDVFVSFSSKDVSHVRAVIEALRARDVSVWWSDEIQRGRWDKEIERRISEAKFVVGFISANAVNSPRDYVFTELDIARETNKLIPVVVGKPNISLAVRGLIALVQTYFFDRFEDIVADGNIDRIAAACGHRSQTFDTQPVQRTPQEKIDDWYSNVERTMGPAGQVRAFSSWLSVAIFENSPLTDIQQISEGLTGALIGAECADDERTDPNFPTRTTPLFKLLECEIYEAVRHLSL